MSLINKAISSLFNGVSQQPAALRLPSQCELQDNAHSLLSEGVVKRPPLEHEWRHTFTGMDNAAIHIIDRGPGKRFAVYAGNQILKVVNLQNGAVYAPSTPNGLAYLTSSDPVADFKFLTVADYTFILNTKQAVSMGPVDTTQDPPAKQARIINYLLAPTVDTTNSCTNASYTIVVNGTTFTQPWTSGWTLNQYASDMASRVAAAFPGLSVVTDSNKVRIVHNTAGAALTVTAKLTDAFYDSVNAACYTQDNTAGTRVDTDFIFGSNLSFAYVKKGVAGTTYTVYLDGTAYSYSSGDTTAYDSYRTTTIAQNLVNAINASGTFTASLKGSAFKITKNDSAPFTFSVTDSWGELALVGIKGNVQKFQDMPPKFFENYTVEVTGDPDVQQDSYFTKWVDNGGTQSGSYLETTAPGIANGFDATTMPFQLIPNADSTAWTFQQVSWLPRKVGNENSAPQPSFVGNTVQDLFFFRDRLGFLSGENVILSRAGDYFNFWPETVTSVLDSDPIDIAASHVRLSLLKHAVPFNETLLLFSDNAQFTLSAEGLLTAKTAIITQTTAFASSPKVRPVSAGQNVFFVTEHGEHSGIKEYFIEPSTLTKDAAEITAHVPRYIPKGIFQMAANTNEDIIVALSSATPNVLYIYKYFWSGDEKVQSAWYTWTLDSGCNIRGIEFLDTKLYCFTLRDGSFCTETFDLQSGLEDTTLGALVHLDHKQYLTGGTYLPASNETQFDVDYLDTTGFIIVRNSSVNGKPGETPKVTRTATNKVFVQGDHSGGAAISGLPYIMRFRFSEQYLKDDAKSPISGRLQLRSFLVRYVKTGYFKALVTPVFRDTVEYVFNGKRLGTGSLHLGAPAIDTGEFRFPVLANAQGVTVELQNDSFLPCAFQSAEWLGEFTSKGRRH